MPESTSPTTPLWRWLLLAAAIIVLDQISKQWVLESFFLYERRAVTGFLNLTHVYNPGAAFSFLADAGGWQKWFFLALALGVSAWMTALLRQHAGERLMPTALAMIIGGALGNAIDRIRFDAVLDFIDVHVAGYHWPAFNVADSSIFVGVALMLWHQIRYSKPLDNP